MRRRIHIKVSGLFYLTCTKTYLHYKNLSVEQGLQIACRLEAWLLGHVALGASSASAKARVCVCVCVYAYVYIYICMYDVL
jgi:hypothetical protein